MQIHVHMTPHQQGPVSLNMRVTGGGGGVLKQINFNFNFNYYLVGEEGVKHCGSFLLTLLCY